MPDKNFAVNKLSTDICAPITSDSYTQGLCKKKAEEALQKSDRDFCKPADNDTDTKMISCFQKEENLKKWSGEMNGMFQHIFWKYMGFVKQGVPRRPQVELKFADVITDIVNEKLLEIFQEFALNNLEGIDIVDINDPNKIYNTVDQKAELFLSVLHQEIKSVGGGESDGKFNADGKEYQLKKISIDMKYNEMVDNVAVYFKYIRVLLDQYLAAFETKLEADLSAAAAGDKGGIENDLNNVKNAMKRIKEENIDKFKERFSEKGIALDMAAGVDPLLTFYYNRISQLMGKVDGEKLGNIEYKVGVKLGNSYLARGADPNSIEEVNAVTTAYIDEIEKQAKDAGVAVAGAVENKVFAEPATSALKFWGTELGLKGGIGAFAGMRTEPESEALFAGEGWLQPKWTLYKSGKDKNDNLGVSIKPLWIFATGLPEQPEDSYASLFTELDESIAPAMLIFLELYGELAYDSLKEPKEGDFASKAAYEKAMEAYKSEVKHGLKFKGGICKYRPDGIGLADNQYDVASSMHLHTPTGSGSRAFGGSLLYSLMYKDFTVQALLNVGSTKVSHNMNEHLFAMSGLRMLGGLGLVYGDPKGWGQVGLRFYGEGSLGDTDSAETIAVKQAKGELPDPYSRQIGGSIAGKFNVSDSDVAGAEFALAKGANLFHQDETRAYINTDYLHKFGNGMGLGLSLQYITQLTNYKKSANCGGLESKCKAIDYIEGNGLTKAFLRFHPLGVDLDDPGSGLIIETGYINVGTKTGSGSNLFKNIFSRLFDGGQNVFYLGLRWENIGF